MVAGRNPFIFLESTITRWNVDGPGVLACDEQEPKQ